LRFYPIGLCFFISNPPERLLFFATFFGFLGLLLALPLTVVAQIWLKEVLIKDVLDQWRDRPRVKADPAGINESSETGGATERPSSEIAARSK
jgi:hypothetical protein